MLDEQEKLGDQKVIGLEYACVVKVASTFYKTDPENALKLCVLYNPIATAQLNIEQSKASLERYQNLAKGTCKNQIEREIENKSGI